MWNSSQYDNSYASGGFVANDTSNIGGVGGNEASRRQRLNNLVPITIAEALASTLEEDIFRSPLGMPLSQVTLLGLIVRVNKSATRCDYHLEDCTGGSLEVRVFIDSESEPIFQEGTYVRCCGHLRAMAGQRTVAAFKLTKVTDFNEITQHVLDVMDAHMIYEKHHGSGAAGFGSYSGLATAQPLANNSKGAVGNIINGLTPIQSQLLHLIRTCTTLEGANVLQIKSALHNVSEKQMRDALDFLQNEGYCYSTVDEDHFKSTDS